MDHLPPDAPRRVLERRDGLLAAEHRGAAARHAADGGTSYVDAGWWFAGHAEPTQEDCQREADHTAHLHRLSAVNVRHSRAMYWLSVLILAAVSELLEVRETAPRTGPQRRRAGPPEPAPAQLALTRSTLTAAPPATASSVPGSRCAVPMAA
ncbi:hypothetical protein [Brachybacterium sp. J144]|uniref:hypothetical protein n=1 Tax=Brachybacterium sp. J144 TaxID=3116487 RepID=UPI002E779F1B|nr:hypothetical protein [Brachybacterium sp. J144]